MDLRVDVEFMGPFEHELGITGAEVVLSSPATVATLLEALELKWPAARKLASQLSDGRQRRRYCLVLLDSTALAAETALETPLHDGARVCFSMPMAGG